MAGGERDRVRDPRRASLEDTQSGYGSHKTLYNGFMRWSRLGVFNCIFAALGAEGLAPERIMINTTHLKGHKTAAGGRQKGAGACRFRN
jgi:hypothetical protein